MKVVICGSMFASKEMLTVQVALAELGHSVVVPEFTEEYATMSTIDKVATESVRNKVKHDLIKGYFNKIKDSDAVLVVNVEKGGIRGYIGTNSFLEMGFAHVLGKKIFLLNSFPSAWHTDEIQAMQPIILNGNVANVS